MDKLPARVILEGNTYTVTDDGQRAYLLKPETVTFNGVPGTPIAEVQALAEATGSKPVSTSGLRWGTIAFADALKSGEIVAA
jgi:hypothetical protein